MSQTKINHVGILCCHFNTSFRSANPNFRLRPKLGRQICLWTESLNWAKDWSKKWSHPLYSNFVLYSIFIISINIVTSALLLLYQSYCYAFCLSVHQCVWVCASILNEWRYLMKLSQLITSKCRRNWWHWEGHWFNGQSLPFLAKKSGEKW